MFSACGQWLNIATVALKNTIFLQLWQKSINLRTSCCGESFESLFNGSLNSYIWARRPTRIVYMCVPQVHIWVILSQHSMSRSQIASSYRPEQYDAISPFTITTRKSPVTVQLTLSIILYGWQEGWQFVCVCTLFKCERCGPE